MSLYRVLVLDDDQDIHNLLKLRFRESSIDLFFAEKLEEAKSRLLKDKYDCMILDIVLGNNVSSIEMINFLKSEENMINKDIPLIVMSSHLDDSYGEQIQRKESMIFHTLLKPIDKSINLEQLVDDTIHAAIFLKG